MARGYSAQRLDNGDESRSLPEALRIAALGGGTGLPNVLRGLCSLLFSSAPRGHEGRMPERLVAIVTTTELGAPLASEGPSGKIRHHPARLAATIAACARFDGRRASRPCEENNVRTLL